MRLLIFDIDGTLTDSVAHHQASYASAYSLFEIAELDTNWSTYTHHSDSWIFAEVFRRNFGRNPTQQENDRFLSAVCTHFDAGLRDAPILEIPGAATYLAKVIASSTVAYAFATGSFRQPALRKLEALGVPYAAGLLVTASEYETRDDIVGGAIEAALSHFGVERFDSITSFGDGYWDLITARNLRIEFVGIARGEKARVLRDAGAAIVYPDFLAAGMPRWY
jgi:phosphoglycolate phosphatase-like HAD superfamily hydrolase